jgi:hypothetical protein
VLSPHFKIKQEVMVKYLSGELLWDRIKTLSENKTKQTVVVSPYIGSNVNNMIAFKPGDFLISSITEANVKQGNVNPSSLEYLKMQGVRIFSINNLHSKIYYFNDSVVVCSANLSENSKNNLVESGIWTDDQETLKSVLEDLRLLCKEEVNLEFIRSLKTSYNPALKITGVSTNTPRASSLHMLSVIEMSYTQDEAELLNSVNKQYEYLLREGHQLGDIRLDIDDPFVNSVSIGDRIIEIRADKNEIYAPKKVLGIELGPQVDGKIKVKFLRLESPINGRGFKINEVCTSESLQNSALNSLFSADLSQIKKKLNEEEVMALYT